MQKKGKKQELLTPKEIILTVLFGFFLSHWYWKDATPNAPVQATKNGKRSTPSSSSRAACMEKLIGGFTTMELVSPNKNTYLPDLGLPLMIPKPVSCNCEDGVTDFVPEKQGAEVAEYYSNIEKAAIKCEQLYSSEKEAGLRDAASLGFCAQSWLTKNIHKYENLTEAKIVFDYGYDGSPFHFGKEFTNDSALITALLPTPNYKPKVDKLLYNQLLASKPTRYRVSALVVTNTMFDIQLALRLEEVFNSIQQDEPDADLLIYMGKLISMARSTFFLLPCSNFSTGHSKFSRDSLVEADIVRLAVYRFLQKKYELGTHQLNFMVKVLQSFTVGSCTRSIVLVNPVLIHKGVRLKWCYYPLGSKYDMIYRRGEYIHLVHRLVQQWSRFAGSKVKTIRRWHPSINMGDILGWGMSRSQRETLFWDMLTQPSCPDAAIQNWLLSSASRILRIDPNQQSWKGKHPVARDYVEFLQIFMCVGVGMTDGGWKQTFDPTIKPGPVQAASPLVHTTKGNKYRFIGRFLNVKAPNGTYTPVNYPNATETNEYSECPSCNECVMHTWRSLKFFWHNSKSLPPKACTLCYECQREKYIGKGQLLDPNELHGCSDVEGVDEDMGPPKGRDELCYEKQLRPLPRDSAPSEMIQKGPY